MDRHMHSAQIERLEIVDTGLRRRWTEDEKLKIVLESLQTPRQVAATARRLGILRSQLLHWRRAFRTRWVQLNSKSASRGPWLWRSRSPRQANRCPVRHKSRHQRLERLRVRRAKSAPLVAALEAWLREQRSRLSNSSSVSKPIDYMLKRWDRFARFLDDGRVCLTNNAAERALRGFALGRKAWLFAGSERGADRAAAMTTLIMTAKLNDVDPQVCLADVLARINDLSIHSLDQLLPWNWKTQPAKLAA